MKRSKQDDVELEPPVSKLASEAAVAAQKKPELKFEDAYGDDIDSEDELILKGEHPSAKQNDDDDDDDGSVVVDNMEEDEELNAQMKQLFRPGVDQLAEDEVLEADQSAYKMYHRMQFSWPCLSFDFLGDNLGSSRTKFPMTCFAVAGTQADSPGNNRLEVLKLGDLCKTRESEDSDDDMDSDDEDFDNDPKVEFRSLKHNGGVNRVRAMPQAPNVVATWADTGRVYMWDVASQLSSLGYGGSLKSSATSLEKPIFAFAGHKDEGFAMDWSPVNAGSLATGDCAGGIHLWSVSNNGQCTVDDTAYTSHTDSVEDLQWSPTESTVFASCSVDQTVQVWDSRCKNKSMLTVKAHDCDVNVIAWNKKESTLIASGADDGTFKVWDLRQFKSDAYIGRQNFHKQPITSIEWHPTDETVLAVGCDDNQTSVWDLALEDDVEYAEATDGLSSTVVGSNNEKIDLPPQLLFLHQGQQHPKELHFHPQMPGVIGATAADGFDVFICEPLDPKTNLHPGEGSDKKSE